MSEIQMGTIQWFPGHMTKTRRMIAAKSVFGGCCGRNSGCQNPQQQPESGNAAFGKGETSHAAPE